MRALVIIKSFFNVFLFLIFPMALLMLIVAAVMMVDRQGAYVRLQNVLQEEVLVERAIVRRCYEEDRFCFAEFTDQLGWERYGRLDWYYSPRGFQDQLAVLEAGDEITIRYAGDWIEDQVILADRFDDFLRYRGHWIEMGGIGGVSWLILILHPEIMLFMLVDDMGALIDQKWKRRTGVK